MQVKLFLSLLIWTTDCMQLLSESHLHGCQIFERFGYFISDSELNFGFPCTPSVMHLPCSGLILFSFLFFTFIYYVCFYLCMMSLCLAQQSFGGKSRIWFDLMRTMMVRLKVSHTRTGNVCQGVYTWVMMMMMMCRKVVWWWRALRWTTHALGQCAMISTAMWLIPVLM